MDRVKSSWDEYQALRQGKQERQQMLEDLEAHISELRQKALPVSDKTLFTSKELAKI